MTVLRAGETPAVERIGPGDLTQLAADVGPVAMNVGAVLALEPSEGFDLDRARATLAARMAGIARFRQRLVEVPLGLGRPIWVDDEDFAPAAHVSIAQCPRPGDRDALLALATSLVTARLPEGRPLWRAVLVTDLAEGQVGLVLILHHVLADGIGGLAVLAELADAGASAEQPLALPRPQPTVSQLLKDQVAQLASRLRGTARAVGRLREARAELGLGRTQWAPRSSLNVPTGPRRRVVTVEYALAAIQGAARRRAVTVNDLLLVAATAALQEILEQRGESVPALVVSVPITARTTATSAHLGNQVGVMPIRVPLSGTLAERLAVVADTTRTQKTRARGASAALVNPAFRALAAVGLFGWMVNRQRLVNTFLTNLRGPARELSFDGAPIRSITPITVTAGNVTVAFAALSYAGRLTISVICDPDHLSESGQVAAALTRALGELTG